jgi:hypothetical protein
MKRIRLAKIAIAITTFACTALLSFGWSEQRGVSLSVESARARVGRPLFRSFLMRDPPLIDGIFDERLPNILRGVRNPSFPAGGLQEFED